MRSFSQRNKLSHASLGPARYLDRQPLACGARIALVKACSIGSRRNGHDDKNASWSGKSTGCSQPYGILFTKDAVCYSGSPAKPNTIVRFDPKMENFQTWAIPGGGDIVRNMDVDRDGNPAIAVLAEQSRRPS